MDCWRVEPSLEQPAGSHCQRREDRLGRTGSAPGRPLVDRFGTPNDAVVERQEAQFTIASKGGTVLVKDLRPFPLSNAIKSTEPACAREKWQAEQFPIPGNLCDFSPNGKSTYIPRAGLSHPQLPVSMSSYVVHSNCLFEPTVGLLGQVVGGIEPFFPSRYP